MEKSGYIVWGWPWQILGAIRKEARAGESGKILFLSRKQRTIFPISHRPNFTTFEHNTSMSVAINSVGTEFGKFFRKGSFFQKKRKNGHFLGVKAIFSEGFTETMGTEIYFQ